MSSPLIASLNSAEPAGLLPAEQTRFLADDLSARAGLKVYPLSIAATRHSLFFLCKRDRRKLLGIISRGGLSGPSFEGQSNTFSVEGTELDLRLCETTSANAALLRALFPHLSPRTLGLRKSAGCGDRLGLATPGHIRAIRHSNLSPVLAQQSIRENSRTHRSPLEVLDDAMWGVFQEGWRDGYGADADHLKTTADIDACLAAGYTFFTIDPGDFVDNRAQTATAESIGKRVESLPWNDLETSLKELLSQLAEKPVDLGHFSITISDEELIRAASKYARAVSHTVTMYRHLSRATNPTAFELEMSVDETDTTTTLAEHVYIAHELKRLGVRWVSLAPRYVGTFEKGVDYMGNLEEFERGFAEHLAVARTFGPYKLSLHSGSDKFSIYPIASRVAGELIHLKTAGTSYLEALRAIADLQPSLFRDILSFAVERFPIDRASYHVSADLARLPDQSNLSDDELPGLLEDFHCREVLHVTYGSVLNREDLREEFFETLCENEEVYHALIESHFDRHFAPFADPAMAR